MTAAGVVDAGFVADREPMLDLRVATPRAWLEVALADLDALLVDHAACERKAFSTGMSLVSSYPTHTALVSAMIDFAREELDHFRIVHRLLLARGLTLAPHAPDPYARALVARIRKGEPETLCDRLLVSGIIEARSCERLLMLSEALPERAPELAPVYLELARAESRHHGLFLRLARALCGEREALERARELLDFEAEVVRSLPVRAAVH
ncbi:MAG TPA: tRNA-(ms[2]io[6]A)-hydroxylase [Polyangiaceae bacterium]